MDLVDTDNIKNFSPVHPFQHGLGRVYEFVRAAITKYHRLHGLNNRNLFSHNSGGWKSKIKVPKFPAELVSSEPCLLGLQMATLVLPLHRVVPLWTSSLGVLTFSSYEDTSQTGLEPTVTASFYFNHLFKKILSLNTVTF